MNISSDPDNAGRQLVRPKVLLLAYSCAPHRGSEPGVGWNRALESAKAFDTWVISREGEFADRIRQYLDTQGDIPGLHFTFVDWGTWVKALSRISPFYRLFFYWFYNQWQRRAFRAAQGLQQQIGFHLVHQLTFCGFREPGYLWKLPVAFIWGPIGGTQNYPWRFLREAGWLGGFAEGLRSVLNNAQLRFSRRIRKAASRARLLLAANSTNQQDFERFLRLKPIRMLETGIQSVAVSPRVREAQRPMLHLLWSGNLAPHKGLSLLLKALARFGREVPYHLRILGAGWFARRWRRLAGRLGVSEQISWMGWLPFPQAQEQYDWADVLVFTSLRDTSGNVVLEALAAGVPVICLDHQGVGDIITEECGIKIPVTGPREVIVRLAEAIRTLAQDRPRWERLSAGALRRAQEFQWSRQGKRLAALYRRVVAEDAGRTGSPPAYSLADSRSAGLPGGPRKTAEDWARQTAGIISMLAARLFSPRVEGALGMLLYHRVVPQLSDLPGSSLNVTPERLRDQIAGLMDRGYVIRPLREVLQNRALGRPPLPRTVVVTFDDGFASVYAYAWPVLRELQAAATIFLNTAYLDGDEPFPFDGWGNTYRSRLPAEFYRPLTWEECREMAESGLVELGSHTHTHRDFRGRPAELGQDTQTSVELLQTRFGMTTVSFAFPGGRRYLGQSGENLVAALRPLPVTCALTTECQPIDWRSDPFGWGRCNVYQWDTVGTLTAKLNGFHSWAPRLQERFLGSRACGSDFRCGGQRGDLPPQEQSS